MFATGDMECPQADQQRFVDAIPTLDGVFTFDGKNHFFFGGANDADFKSELDKLLKNSGRDIKSRICNRRFRW